MADGKSLALQFESYAKQLEFFWYCAQNGFVKAQQCVRRGSPGIRIGGKKGMSSRHYSQVETEIFANAGYGHATRIVLVALVAQFEDTFKELCSQPPVEISRDAGKKRQNWFEYRYDVLKKSHSIDCLAAGVDLESIVERVEVRNCVMHHGGLADGKLLTKCPKTEFEDGKELSITEDYLAISTEWLPQIVKALEDSLP
ncbi:MAG: hypothetical protein HY318_15170 [Armatimonadetes bacterium]|nr:hypothetical protein [Armatimonadota bacterium]